MLCIELQTFRNNDFDKEMMQYCELPNRYKRGTSTACSATEQKLPVLFPAKLGIGKIEFTSKLIVEIAGFEQDDNYGLQPSYIKAKLQKATRSVDPSLSSGVYICFNKNLIQ